MTTTQAITMTAAVALEVLRFASAIRRLKPDATDEQIAQVWAESRSDFLDAVVDWRDATQAGRLPPGG